VTAPGVDEPPDGLARRLGGAVVLLVVLVVPAGLALLLGGAPAARGAGLGAVFGLLLALRSGWRRALLVVPGLVAGIALGSLASGTPWWVLLVAAVGVAAGLATRLGALPGLATVGMLVSTTLPGSGRPEDLPVLLLGAGLAGGYAVLVARRLGVPESVPSPTLGTGDATAVALVLGLVAAVAAAVAASSDGRFAYWLPMTVFVLALPTPGLRYSQSARSRVGGTLAGLLAGVALSPLPWPAAARVALALALLLLVLALLQPIWLNAALSTLLVVVLLDPAGAGVAAAGSRLLATVVAAALVLVGLGVLLWWGRRTGRTQPQQVRDLVAAQAGT
jgi:hypothetical protein